MASSSLAATGLTASQTAIRQQQQQQALLNVSGSPAPPGSSKSAAAVTTVAIRNGKTIGINDHIYISAAWAPGAGEPYMIARVMDFVTAASSRSGAAALASSSGTLQVRANVFLRMRDISLRNSNDPRLLVATMHSDVFNLENVRGICNVRHRDLIGSGSAPDVSQWKKKEDHFYYHQLYDRYIHRFYDVIPTEKVRNAPPEVLSTLRTRYSFIVAEIGMLADLCDALRGCAVCHRWAASVESVRCDTCKKFFHMKCVNPPLASKPAKGYSWTCAPCSKRHEQDVGHALATGGTIPSATNGSVQNGQGLVRAAATASAKGRGMSLSAARGRGLGGAVTARRALLGHDDPGSSDISPDGSPSPERTIDDVRGTRCFNRWPYRYFGQHTHALDVLDPHDSVYPIATTRLGVKYQAVLPSWEEQKAAGLGVHFRAKGAGKEEEGHGGEEASEAAGAKAAIARRKSRSVKRKRGGTASEQPDRSDTPVTGANTPTMLPTAMPSEPPEFERGTETSVEPIFLPSVIPEERMLDAYMRAAKLPIKNVPGHNVDLLNRALTLLTEKQGQLVGALQALSQSKPEDLRIVPWSAKELKQFETGMKECSSDIRQLKKRIPTKKPGEIVRHFVVWKTQRLREDLQSHAGEQNGRGASTKIKGSSNSSGSSKPSTSRAVSPSLSVFGDDEMAASAPSRSCSMCSTGTSEVWYKGPASWPNRSLCINCGLYWRKYAAEAHNTELISVNTRHKSANAVNTAAAVTATAAEENGVLGVPPFNKLQKGKANGKAVAAGSTSAVNGATTTGPGRSSSSDAASASSTEPKVEPPKCVLCNQVEPRQTLAQCQSCSLNVHRACFGLNDADWKKAAAAQWFCEACENEETLDAALVPRCILCSKQAQADALAIAIRNATGEGKSTSAGASEKSKGKGVRSGADSKAAAAKAAPNTAAAPNGTSASLTTDSSAATLAKQAPAPLGPLDAFKPTECNNWVHLLCALFTPEVVFSDTTRLKTVEGCGNLPGWRYDSTCCLCEQRTGSCITCADSGCKRTFHVSCAVNRSPSEFVLGFEINPLGKGKRTSSAESVTFRGETGVLTAVVYCAEHREGAPSGGKKGGKIHDLADANSTLNGSRNTSPALVNGTSSVDDQGLDAGKGEGGHRSAETALQLFSRVYKHVGAHVTGSGSSNAASAVVANMTDSSYALLRRAKRFDLLASSATTPSSSSAPRPNRATTTTPAPSDLRFGLSIGSRSLRLSNGAAKQDDGSTADLYAKHEEEAEECCKCHTRFSPFWWSVPVAIPEEHMDTDDAHQHCHADQERAKTETDTETAIKVEPPSFLPYSPVESQSPKQTRMQVCCTFCRPSVLPDVQVGGKPSETFALAARTEGGGRGTQMDLDDQ